MAEPEVHEAALAGIFCRSGVPHPQLETLGPPCQTCAELAEYAVIALWDHAVAEGRLQATKEVDRSWCEAVDAASGSDDFSAAAAFAAGVARGRQQAAEAVRAVGLNYPESVFLEDGESRDAIAGTAMRHAYRYAARVAEGDTDD